MPYVTFAELADRPGATELAQVAGPRHLPPVPAALMDATLRAADRSAWTPDQRAAADLAAARVTDAVAEAGATIEGFLVQGGYSLPLALPPGGSGMSVLVGWARSITRYLLNQSRITDETKDPIARDYRDAMKLLRLVAEGKFSLGAVDPAAAEGAGSATDVRFDGAPTVFGRDQLGAFR